MNIPVKRWNHSLQLPIYSICVGLVIAISINLAKAQETPSPGKASPFPVIIREAMVHPGNGDIARIADILIIDGKIQKVGEVKETYKQSTEIQGQGKHVYPGFIGLNTQLGLIEIEAARPTQDTRESGLINPNLRAAVAYNTDSRVIPTVRSNGVLLAQVVGNSGVINGSSAVMQLDAWNWEDALIREDGVFINWPEVSSSSRKTSLQELESLFKDARAYATNQSTISTEDLRVKSILPIFTGHKKLFIEVNQYAALLEVIAFIKRFQIQPVLVGVSDGYRILDQLKSLGIPVILTNVNRLPDRDIDSPEAPFKLPAILDSSKITFALSIPGFWQVRNLAFTAGTAIGYDLSPEAALKSICLTPAKLCGIDNNYGSIEVGKSATLLICSGDVFNMATSNVETAFIDGRQISLDNKQEQLYRKYRNKDTN